MDNSFIAAKKILDKHLFKKHTSFIDSLPKSQIGLWIALAAGLGLFFELLIIRVHSSYFQLFAYLKNVSLLSCFLGIAIGYARGSKKLLYTPLVVPLMGLQVISMYLLRNSKFATLLQNPISEQLSLGLSQAGSYKQLFIFAFVIFVFVFNALCFIPLGQLAGRLMNKLKPLPAYSWNLIGSLVGIILFSLLSLLWSPPQVWFIVASVLLILFLYKDKLSMAISVIVLTVVMIILSWSPRLNQFDIFSPYQILTLNFYSHTPPVLLTSNSYYQKILDLRPQSIGDNKSLQAFNEYYSIPYTIKQRPEQVLVVGSGTGNDVAAALRNGAGHVDAVEIDPAILKAGEVLHPEGPYQDIRVTKTVNDARSFIRYTNNQYDLIVYGLLDSHTLLSGRGGIRLDSYVYTVEAFKEARKRLKKDGAISLTFAVMSGELGNKLYLMLQQAFEGQSPLVYYSKYDGGYTFLAGDGVKDIGNHPSFENVSSQFGEGSVYKTNVSTDDWPFFYMPIRKYPVSSVALILLLLAISLVSIQKLVGKSKYTFSIPCFFLGAGFMLLETKGVTELALTYGTTWYVNTIVIASILIMGFLANLYMMRKGVQSRNLTYLLLFVSIAVSFLFTYFKFGIGNPLVAKIAMPIALTLPLFFSGMAFSSELKKSANVGTALYSNLMGAMLGGFLEYNSMYFGFRSLYIIAFVMYLLAFVVKGKRHSSVKKLL